MTSEQFAIVQRIDAACGERVLCGMPRNLSHYGPCYRDAIAWRILMELDAIVPRSLAGLLPEAERVLLK